MNPALFVSHGSPTLPFDDCDARTFLISLGKQLAKPSAILTISAHWECPAPKLNAPAKLATIHDFYGFAPHLYEQRYAAPAAPALAERAATMLAASSLAAEIDTARGLDHGAWVPLMLMFPEADIPVVQLSVQPHLGVRHHIALGRALRALRRDGVLILASGGFVHNLRSISWDGGAEPAWVGAFSDWVHERLMARDDAALETYRRSAPHAVQAHPSEEHFMPLFVAYGAGDGTVERLHRSTTFATLRMDAYAFA